MSQPRADRPENPEETVVVANNLTRTYNRGSSSRFLGFRGAAGPSITALEGVSISVSTGECVGIKGPSGSGKTTLLHLLAGLDTPTEGHLHLAGRNIGPETSERTRAAHRLRTVGIVFQRFHLLPALSARANVALPLVQLGQSKASRRSRAESLLEQVGLGDRVTHKPGELSGGEQQRVAIARALATDPALLIADEPTGELDSETAKTILDIFAEVADERAVIVASHDEQALGIADRIVSLHDGRIAIDD